MDNDVPVLDRVRKLLAKAEDPSCPPAEAEALTAKAAELIAKYGIDRAMLAASSDEADVLGDRVIVVDPPYALDKTQLLGGVAEALRCRAVRRTHYAPPEFRKQLMVHLFGFGSDLERTELLYTSLLIQSANALASRPVPPWQQPAAFRRSWLAGFTSAVVARLREAERRAERQAERDPGAGSSVALVLADRTALVDRRMAEEYPRVRNAPPRRLSGSGFRDGQDAGRRADLGGTRVGRRSAAAIPRRR
ncbi:MAG: DUF2786 domain-containing protein [Streptosporangiales bacterium]|nr:DUF2786 domain-containing protein [Streptosporangiales bacterium]